MVCIPSCLWENTVICWKYVRSRCLLFIPPLVNKLELCNVLLGPQSNASQPLHNIWPDSRMVQIIVVPSPQLHNIGANSHMVKFGVETWSRRIRQNQIRDFNLFGVPQTPLP